MTNDDRARLDELLRRLATLESSLAELKGDFQGFTQRVENPVPVRAESPHLPPVPLVPASPEGSAPESVAPVPAIPTQEPIAPELPGPGFEVQFGRWLARIGALFALLTLVYFSIVTYHNWLQYAGPWAKLAILTVVGGGLVGGGLWLERSVPVYGRTVAGAGLACLYYTLYGAIYVEPLRVISSPLLGGMLLLAWSAAVLVLAEHRKSELLSIFAISLAYVSSAVTPVGDFTMVADLVLAGAAVVFLLRNAWTNLPVFCLVGTYLGGAQQVFLALPGFSIEYRHLPAAEFAPLAAYLFGAWVIFTAGTLLARASGFDGANRIAFLSLNNGAAVALLVVAAVATRQGHLGILLLVAAALLFGAWALARFALAAETDVVGAYLLQALIVGTTGLVIAYHGVTRGLIITLESVLLAAAASQTRGLVARLCAAVAGLLGTGFLFAETLRPGPFPWWLAITGAVTMLFNAWLERRAAASPRTFVPLSAYYVALAQILVIRWVYGVYDRDEITLVLFALATLCVFVGLMRNSGALVRAVFIFDVVGVGNYTITQLPDSPLGFTWFDATAFALLVAQPVLLCRLGRAPVSRFEIAAVAVASSLAAWLFISNSVHMDQLTLGWAVLALALVLIGFFSGERFQRWSGLAILLAACGRVAFHDFWGYSDAGKVLTFLALTVTCLGLSFVYYKFGERLKKWL